MDPKSWEAKRQIRSLRGDHSAQAMGDDFITIGILGIVGVLVVVLIAGSVFPTMFNQTAALETNPDLSASNQQLVAVFDTLAVVSFILLPLALIFLVIRLARRGRTGRGGT